MCVAIVVPKGVKPEVEILEKAFKINRDGGGIAYIDPARAGGNKDPKVQIRKGFFKFDEFLDAYHPIADKYGRDNPMLIHFRIATQGRVTLHNCHPFKIVDGALIHNGHFPGYNEGRGAENSDTKMFVSAICNNMRYEDALAAKNGIENTIGAHNKIATLHDNGEFIRFNEPWWTLYKGVYYSNRGPLPASA